MTFRGRGILLSYDSLTGTLCAQVVIDDRLAFGQMYQTIPVGKLCALNVGRWYPRKSTGPDSQNSHAFGHARTIGQHIGEDVEEVLHGACIRAEKRGYPVRRDEFGMAVPKPWREVNSAEASYVIDQLHEDADFLGLQLVEREWGNEESRL